MTEHVLEFIMLLVVGYLLLAIEIFLIPGFGVIGIGGILCLTIGSWLALRTLGTGAGGVVVAGVLLSTTLGLIYLPRTAMGRWMIHRGSLRESKSALPVAVAGEVGVTETPLRPSGIARFAARRESVVSQGEFIEAGAAVQVVLVEGSRVVVKTCDRPDRGTGSKPAAPTDQ